MKNISQNVNVVVVIVSAIMMQLLIVYPTILQHAQFHLKSMEIQKLSRLVLHCISKT